MKLKSIFRKAALPLALMAAFPCAALAQQQVTPYGQAAIVMNKVTTPIATPTGAAATTCHPPVGVGLTCEIQSLGQNVHYLSYTTTGTGLVVDIRLEGSFDGTSFFAISADATATSSQFVGQSAAGAVCGFGYYPYIRANLIAFSGAGDPTLTALYSGTSATSGCPLGTFNPSQNQTRIALPFGTTESSLNITSTVNAPFGNSYGTLYVYTNSISAGGSISAVALGTAPTGVFTPVNADAMLATQALTNAANAWYAIPLPYFPSSQVQIQFASGGVSSGTLYAFIVFAAPAQDAGNLGAHITTATNTAIKVGTGTFFSLSVNQVASSGATATVYDGTSSGTCGGTVIAIIGLSAIQGPYWFNQQFYSGLCVTTTGGTPADITVNYR